MLCFTLLPSTASWAYRRNRGWFPGHWRLAVKLGGLMKWSVEPGTFALGTWLVGRSDDRVDVIGAPGTRIPCAERAIWHTSPQMAGWRHARWNRVIHASLNLDRDPPDRPLRVIGTCEVLELVDVSLHQAIRIVLTEQLETLEAMDLLPEMTQDPAFERAAHSEIMAVAWVRAELGEAFPEEYEHLREPAALITKKRCSPYLSESDVIPEKLPETVAEFESQLTTIVYSQGLGGRELIRLLKRRLIWRVIEPLPRWFLIAIFTLSPDAGEIHELVSRRLTYCAFGSDWPVVTNLDKVSGRARKIVALGWPENTGEREFRRSEP